jgi:hypothetical protein
MIPQYKHLLTYGNTIKYILEGRNQRRNKAITSQKSTIKKSGKATFKATLTHGEDASNGDKMAAVSPAK